MDCQRKFREMPRDRSLLSSVLSVLRFLEMLNTITVKISISIEFIAFHVASCWLYHLLRDSQLVTPLLT